MKKIFIGKYVYLLIATIYCSNILNAQNNFFDQNIDTSKKILVLLHPTVANIENFIWLNNHDILDLEQTIFVGIYHKDERYNYLKSINYLDTNKVQNYFLHEFSGNLKIDNLFQENSITEEFNKLFKLSDGIIFFGGPDIPPAIYGEKTNLLTQISDQNRHYFEASILFHLLGGFQDENFEPLLMQNPEYIVWAFCLGMQTMNVATGGTLIQDIPSEIYQIKNTEDVFNLNDDQIHRNYNKPLSYNEKMTGGKLHKIDFTENGFFINELGFNKKNNPLVYSYHHQCIGKIGKNLKIEAKSMDQKIIEAVSHQVYKNVLGLQFHPEKYSLYDENKNYQFYLNDTTNISFHNLLIESNSLDFNKSIWTYFSTLFNETNTNK